METATTLRIDLGSSTNLATETTQAIKEAGIEVRSLSRRKRNISAEVTQIIVALGSAGAFTVLYQIITKFIDKNKGWEVTLESKSGKKITIKGPVLGGVQELLAQLAPELIEYKSSKQTESQG